MWFLLFLLLFMLIVFFMGIMNIFELFVIGVLSHIIISIVVSPIMILFGYKTKVTYLKPLIDLPLNAIKRSSNGLVNVNDIKQIKVFHKTESNLENYGFFESRDQKDRLTSISNMTKEVDE